MNMPTAFKTTVLYMIDLELQNAYRGPLYHACNCKLQILSTVNFWILTLSKLRKIDRSP